MFKILNMFIYDAIRTTLNFGGYMMQFSVLFSAVLSIFLAVFQEMAFGANQIGL